MKTNNQPYDEMTNQVIEALRPHHDLKPSATLRDRMLQAAERELDLQQPNSTKPFTLRLWRWGGALLSAAAAIALAVVMVGHSPAYAARKYLEGAVKAMSETKSLEIALRIRTLEEENFEYTHPQADFVPHKVKVVYGTPTLWRIEKGGRTMLYNGVKGYQWISSTQSGWVMEGEYSDGMVDLLTHPNRLLEAEIALARSTRDASYEMTEYPGSICLVVEMPAQGDYSESDYQLNTSILESNTRRTYHFDRESGRLTYACIIGVFDQGERVLLEIDSIRYDEPIDIVALTALPNDFVWSEHTIPETNHTILSGISPEEAARQVLTAMQNWDKQTLNVALHFYPGHAHEIIKDHYKGVELLEVGKAFRSGAYPGVFVPCRIRKPDGTKEELQLALRNDNRQQIWLVDGGL